MPQCLNHNFHLRFRHGDFEKLRDYLFADPQNESFALLLTEKQIQGRVVNLVVREIVYPGHGDYVSRSRTRLDLKKEFVHRGLVELQARCDVNCLVDVHTHPFAAGRVNFSGLDDADELNFAAFLDETFSGHPGYASVVFGRDVVRGRVWDKSKDGFREQPLRIHTQTAPEMDRFHDENAPSAVNLDTLTAGDAIYNRGLLALGRETMREITGGRRVAIVGVGGLGSVMAEHLVHMGFLDISLIDHDELEISNMNRIVGATFLQARRGVKKVAAVAGHLHRINPGVKVRVCPEPIESPAALELLAASDWILLATDNHASRFLVQKTALKHFIPMISAGVNITVDQQRIEDISGEVITVRAGDGFCLNCIGRLNYAQIAQASSPDPEVRRQLVSRGYVSGAEIKEPAVKTLNTMLATLAVDTLVEQFAGNHPQTPILVYENNGCKCIYPDRESLEAATGCLLCQG